jgi:uncharacterized protein (DUF1697 family)
MTRYVAFLRGVSPMNCKMPELKRCFEAAGFEDVRTLLSSGNVAFSATPAIVPVLEKKIEAAMRTHLDREFRTIVRPSDFLQAIVESNRFAEFELPADAKRIVTFLRKPHDGAPTLPLRRGRGAILKFERTEAYSVYVPDDKDNFGALLEKTFGQEITTRTLDTVRKCAAA